MTSRSERPPNEATRTWHASIFLSFKSSPKPAIPVPGHRHHETIRSPPHLPSSPPPRRLRRQRRRGQGASACSRCSGRRVDADHQRERRARPGAGGVRGVGAQRQDAGPADAGPGGEGGAAGGVGDQLPTGTEREGGERRRGLVPGRGLGEALAELPSAYLLRSTLQDLMN